MNLNRHPPSLIEHKSLEFNTAWIVAPERLPQDLTHLIARHQWRPTDEFKEFQVIGISVDRREARWVAHILGNAFLLLKEYPGALVASMTRCILRPVREEEVELFPPEIQGSLRRKITEDLSRPWCLEVSDPAQGLAFGTQHMSFRTREEAERARQNQFLLIPSHFGPAALTIARRRNCNR